MVDVSGIGAQGYSSPYNAQNQIGAGAQNQLTAGETSRYEKFFVWQSATQQALEETVMMDMALIDDEVTLDQEQWDAKYDEIYNNRLQQASSFSFVEEGETYSKGLDTMVQTQLDAYDAIQNDGKISYEEFAQRELLECNMFLQEGEAPITEESAKAQLEAGFKFMDLNQDSMIDTDEIKAYYIAADMYDKAANPPANPEDAMDGNIKFSSVENMSGIISTEAPEGTAEAEQRTQLKSALIETYNTFAANPITEEQEPQTPIEPAEQDPIEPQGKPGQKPIPLAELQCEEPTALGKIIFQIEKNIFNNPFAQ